MRVVLLNFNLISRLTQFTSSSLFHLRDERAFFVIFLFEQLTNEPMSSSLKYTSGFVCRGILLTSSRHCLLAFDAGKLLTSFLVNELNKAFFLLCITFTCLLIELYKP